MAENYIYNVNKHYKDIIVDCISKMNAMKVPISKSITFKETTGFSRYGFCKKTLNRDTHYAIAINKWFVEDSAIQATVMHELLHTVFGCYNHGKKFHLWAEAIYRESGILITVTGNHKLEDSAYKNKGIRRNVFKEEDFNPQTMVMMFCPKCNNTFAIKKTAFRRGARWICRKCRVQLLYR